MENSRFPSYTLKDPLRPISSINSVTYSIAKYMGTSTLVGHTDHYIHNSEEVAWMIWEQKLVSTDETMVSFDVTPLFISIRWSEESWWVTTDTFIWMTENFHTQHLQCLVSFIYKTIRGQNYPDHKAKVCTDRIVKVILSGFKAPCSTK